MQHQTGLAEARRAAAIERFTHPGTMRWPMTVEQQKAAGLIATVNRSIHPRHWHKAKTSTSKGEQR